MYALTRRRSQLDLLAQVCAARVPVDVAPRGSASVAAHFREISGHTLVLDAPAAAPAAAWPAAASIALHFECGADAYTAHTRPASGAETRGPVPGWRFALPTRIEPRAPRREYRLSLAGLAAFAATCRPVEHAAEAFVAELCDLSARGLLARVWSGAGQRLTPGALCWIRFNLPAAPAPCEFVVRIAHVTPHPAGGLSFGGPFCAGEDPAQRRQQFECIEKFVLAARATGAFADGARPEGGSSC